VVVVVGSSFKRTGADTVGSNALIAVVNSYVTSQIYQPCLTGRIRNVWRGSCESGHRGDDYHNAAFLLLDHLRQTVLAGEVLPLVVHIVRTVLDLFGKLVQITVFVVHLDTGVRSEYVESAERFDGLRNCRFYLLRIGDVGRNRHC